MTQEEKEVAWERINDQRRDDKMTGSVRKCTFGGCDAPHLSRGFCGGHYRQFNAGEKLRPLTGKHLTLEHRFWARVTKTPKCWIFIGPSVGIGHVVFNGLGENLAHRVSWKIHFGDIPRGDGHHGTVVMHKCDVPNCVRPDHLAIGTQAENMADARRKGRIPSGLAARNRTLAWAKTRRGELWHSAKLSNAQASEIIKRRSDGESTTALANEFGVSPSLVSRISRGERRGRK